MDSQAVKRHAIEVAARAVFEFYKVSIDELQLMQWEAMPEGRGVDLPAPNTKAFYRHEVSTAVEALARAGMLKEPGHDW